MKRTMTETLKREIAYAAGLEVANRRARKASRKAWNRADYNAAVREWHRVYNARA